MLLQPPAKPFHGTHSRAVRLDVASEVAYRVIALLLFLQPLPEGLRILLTQALVPFCLLVSFRSVHT